MRYFFKQYWRYIAMALAFATFNFLINGCEVKAQTQMQTFELNHFWAGNETPHTIFSSTNTLKNYGRGYLTFSFAIYRYGENTSFTIPTLSGVNVNTGDAIWACNVGTTSNDFSQDDILKVNFYTAVCDVNIGSQGIRTINLELALLNNNWNIKTSQFATFTNDVSMDIYTYLGTINSTIANYIGTTNSLIASKIDSTNAYLSVIQTILNTNIPSITNAIISGNNQAHNDAQAQKEATEDINESINSDDTTGGSTQANSFFNNFDSGSTGSLMDIVSLPLDFLDSLNNTCQPIQITIPYFNETYNLPCIRTYLNNKFPTIVTLITLIVNGFLCYGILKAFIDLINKLKDPNNDDIEVMDL